ncbi:hypothetical protein C206_27097 [Pseudomonas putida TRO1]|uniref:Uncharacterized protein n=1 Tax=Pseudomonas putida TRO1 TaxID=1227924 RepID=A0AAD2W5M6_PSEPU|nr:hypothetical protein C206_27097 [Pseudomonas putida TRO1]
MFIAITIELSQMLIRSHVGVDLELAGANTTGGQTAQLSGGEVGVVEGAVGECDTVGQATIDVAVGDVIADIVLALEVAAGFGCGGDFDFD